MDCTGDLPCGLDQAEFYYYFMEFIKSAVF